MNTDFWALCGHIAYFIIFLSFLVRKIIWLRTLSIFAGLFSITYNYTVAQSPLWTPIQWNMLFILTNLFHLYSLLRENRVITFTGYEKMIYEKIFHGFRPYQFKKIINISHVNGCIKGQKIIEQDGELDELYLIIKGNLSVEVDGQFIVNLRPGDFVGEMSFITGETTRANVFAKDNDARILSWNTKELKLLLEKNSEINSLFTATLGRQLINQLMNKSLQQNKPQEFKLVS